MYYVEWRKRDETEGSTRGWDLYVSGTYRGVVWLDGSYSYNSAWPKHFRSQPLAAGALLRDAGVVDD
jgi:hypothetical protein